MRQIATFIAVLLKNIRRARPIYWKMKRAARKTDRAENHLPWNQTSPETVQDDDDDDVV